MSWPSTVGLVIKGKEIKKLRQQQRSYIVSTFCTLKTSLLGKKSVIEIGNANKNSFND
jgi:hypothetical protein